MNNRWQSVLLSLALFGLAACTGDFEDINRNPNQVTDDQMDALNYKTGTKFKALQSLVIPVQEHMYQFNESLSGGPFGGYIGATVDTWQTKFETYNPSADWRKWPFANVITETYTPYKGIVNGTEDEVAIAFARLLRVAIMHRVTDSYGPIPYSKLESNESVYVEYDSQEAVYTKMFEELDEAIEILGRNTTLPAEAWSRYDGVYYGNIAQWLKYANSLKLRMAMRLSYVKSDVARAKAAEAIAGGVIEANADNAAMHAAENRTTLIYNDWGDHRVGADILCYMNGYKDPRMEKMFLANDVGDYVGIRIGIDVTSKSQAMSKYSNMIVASDTPYLWFNAAEATFLHAEYELRWGSAETAKTLYEQAVRLSFEERGASGATLSRSAGQLQLISPERNHRSVGNGDGRQRYGGRSGAQPRTHHRAEMDRYLPVGSRSMVGTPPYGVSETAACTYRQIGRFRQCGTGRTPSALPCRGVPAEQRQPSGGHSNARCRATERRPFGRRHGNPRMVGLQTV